MIKRCRQFLFLVFTLILFLQFVNAENLYVTSSGAGATNGSDWNNAFAGFTDVSWGSGGGQLGAGDTLWAAGGNYTAQLELRGSGNSSDLIMIKRARAVDSNATSSTGWNSSYDSQVLINVTDGIMISSSLANGPGRYVLVDGQGTDGIRVDFKDVSQGRGILVEGYGSYNSTFRNIGSYGPSRNLSGASPFVNDVRTLVVRNYDSSPSSEFVSNIIFENNTFSGAAAFAYIIYTKNITIQHSDIHTIETIGSEVHTNLMYIMRSHNVTIRYNNFHDNAAGTGIFFTDFGSSGTQSSYFWIYGNIFRDDNGTSERFIDVRDTANGTGPLYIYNNVFVNGYGGIAIGAPLNESAESYIRNNLFVNVPAYSIALPGGEDYVTLTNNTVANYSEFVSQGSSGTLAFPYNWQYIRDLHILANSSARNVGTNLGVQFSLDKDGVTRGADGSWDNGAYEYVRPIVYYVATWGSNASAGTASVPWRNIQYALNNVSNGDTIYIENGSYVANLTITTHGITITSNSSTRPVLSGNINVGSSENISINFLNITDWSGSTSGILQEYGSGMTVANSSVHTNTTILSAGYCIKSRNSTRLKIENNHLYNCITGLNIQSAYSIDKTYANGAIAKNNTIHNNNVDGINIHGEYITIDGNYIYDNIDPNWSNFHPDGIQGVGSVVDGLYSINHTIIKNNIIKHQTQNIFISGVNGSQDSDCNDVSIYNNVLYNIPDSIVNGVNISAISIKNIGIYGCKNMFIYGNTIGWSNNNGILVQASFDGGTYIKNNIIVNNTIAITIEQPNDVANGSIDYNIYYGNGDAVKLNNTYYSTRLNLSQMLNFEGNGSDSDPRINDFPTPNLQSNSPAINTGLNLGSNFSTDVNGTSRPQGIAWDLGAYEFLFSNPIVTVNSPASYYNSTSSTNIFNCSVAAGVSISNVTLYGNWSNGWHANQTTSLGGLSNNTNFTKVLSDGNYIWNCLAYDSSHMSSFASSNYTLTVDSSAPVISLVSPANNSIVNSTNTISFIYNVTDFSSVSNCSLIIGSSIYQTNSSITKDINQTISQELSSGNYSWSVNCTDLFGNVGSSTLFNISMDFNDTSAPNITILSPSNGTTTIVNSVFVNVSTLDDSNHSVFLDWNNSLVLWLPFDIRNQSESPTSLASYTINVSKVGGAFYNGSGIRGGTFQFNTSGDGLRLPTNQNLNLTSRTVTFWSNLKSLRDYNTILYPSDGNYLALRSTGNLQVYWVNGSGSSKSATLAVGASTNVWQFFAIVHNVTGSNVNISVYRNGNVVAGVNSSDGLIGFPIVAIGNFDNFGANFFNGSIDEFMVFNRVLSSQEIKAIYNAEVNPLHANFTELVNGTYNYKAHSIDLFGNYNSTTLRTITINTSADIFSPSVTINNPSNTSYSSATVSVNISLSEQGLCYYSLDLGVTNNSLDNSGNINFNGTTSSLSNGAYQLWAYCNDSLGNRNDSISVNFSVSVSSGSNDNSGGGSGGGGGGIDTKTYSVTVDKLENGYTNNLGKGDKILFNFDNAGHSLTLDKIDSLTATITVKSSPKIETLSIGQKLLFELNNDSYYDLSVLLNGIKNNKANISIISVHEFINGNVVNNEINASNNNEDIESTNAQDNNEKSPINLTGIIYVLVVIAILVIIVMSITFYRYKKDKHHHTSHGFYQEIFR